MHDPTTRGELDGDGAVVSGVVVTVAEPGDVAGVTDEHPGKDRPDPEQIGDGRAGSSDGGPDPLVRCLELGVEATAVAEELDGQVVANLLRWRGWAEGLEEPIDVRGVDFLGDPASREFGQQGVPAAHEPCSLVADVGVALGQESQHLAMADRFNPSHPSERSAAIATDSASFGSFLLDRPVDSTLTREARVAGTSTTVSPATSC